MAEDEASVVYKYEMYAPHLELDLPIGSKVVHVAAQHDMPMLWVLQPVRSALGLTERRTFVAHGTGVVFPSDDREFLGTVMTIDGMLVYHIFEKTNN